MPSNRTHSESSSEPEFTALDSILQERLGKAVFAQYLDAKIRHFARWKYQKIHEFSSLHFLRWALFAAGVLTLNRHGGWRIDRSRAEYEEMLGIHDELTRIHPEQLSGKSNPFEPLIQADSGPGNCTAMYEMARPGWVIQGLSNELLYSVEGTLRNCLVDGLNQDDRGREVAYHSNGFHETLRTLEILSVFEFLLAHKFSEKDKSDLARPFDLLTGGESDTSTIERSCMIAAVDSASHQMAKTRHMIEGEDSLVSLMLGFLIDELVCRLSVPNGMHFCYEITQHALTALISRSSDICSTLASRGEDVSDLFEQLAFFLDECNKFGTQSAEEQVPTDHWCAKAIETADSLRRLGFESRRHRLLGENDTQFLFTVANELWRWIFFLRHRETIRRDVTNDIGQIDIAFEWLRRPWGIVRVDDIDIAFRGLVPGDENDDMPRGFSVLTTFLQTEIEDFLVADIGFSDADTGVSALHTYIGRRLWLNQLRHEVKFVQIDDATLNDQAELARMVVDLFSAWVYDPANSKELKAIAERPGHMLDLLRSGSWLGSSGEDVSALLNRTQYKRFQTYRDNPGRIISEHFQFDSPEFEIVDHLDVYPPERFFFFTAV